MIILREHLFFDWWSVFTVCYCRVSSYFQFLFIILIMFLSAYVQSEPCTFVSIDNNNVDLCEEDYRNNLLEQMENLICPFPNLREAMADERMAQVIAGKNVFQTIASNDVVRLRKDVGLYVALNPLKKKIHKTYKDFYEVVHTDFTLNITTYPAEVKKDSCVGHSTIVKKPTAEKNFGELEILLEEGQLKSTSETLGVKRDISEVFGDYLTVEGKKPRYFELREDLKKNEEGKRDIIIICENSKNSLDERLSLYCDGDNSDKCKKQMPPLCSEWDKNNNQSSEKKNICSSWNTFEKISGDFFLHNITMNHFCPDDCSYYVQLLQRVRKKESEHCVESHAIVHCGPKKTEAKYNLNIKVVDDFCEDFNVMCVPDNLDQIASQ